MTSTGKHHDWPVDEETVAICEGCGAAVSPYKTADGWVWRHRSTRRFACEGSAPTHAHVTGTTRVPVYDEEDVSRRIGPGEPHPFTRGSDQTASCWVCGFGRSHPWHV